MVFSNEIIQGGMGAWISNWRLAQAVSKTGQLGVVSGTGLGPILSYRLQLGDVNGDIKRAVEKFPNQDMAERIYEKHFIEGGKAEDSPFKNASMSQVKNSQSFLELSILANFVEVTLAKEGHNNPVGINYLEKIQMPLLPEMYGAMLAGVDNILVGAGVPLQVAGILDSLSEHNFARYKLDVKNTSSDVYSEFDPKMFGCTSEDLNRPDFFPIVSLPLAVTMLRGGRGSGEINGFVVEGNIAGGHNAPPRDKKAQLDEHGVQITGEPIYGKKDIADLAKMRNFELPFWLAGGYGNREGLQIAQEEGANGTQTGTMFSLSEESGLYTPLKEEILTDMIAKDIDIFTDRLASPTGFPFKVIQKTGTLSEESVYKERERRCALGYLRQIVEQENGIVYRCPSEPVDSYLAKGGKEEDTIDRKCLCEALIANIGMAQIRDGYTELPLITAGDDINAARDLIPENFLGDKKPYSAEDVVNFLLNK